ncbi:efflux transporter outer membrane subunit [Epilithonimonas tenax]|uniref:efflux transporter outer membrane subunit n=1 Tax=Epilithonimonas tenax TaxID=191577 RepID=UPI0004077710|nr:efflux transporter outer membrane subunit [Epilithonimonas tenax]
MKLKNLIILAGVAGFFYSCKVTDTYNDPEIEKNQKDHLFRQKTNNDSTSIANVAWDQIFTDVMLQNIIRKTIENNLDLKVAVAKIQEADAVFKQSQLQNLPSLDGIASVRDTKNSAAAQGSNFVMPDLMNYQLGISTGWEVDIWGRIKSLKRAAYAGFMQSDAAKRAVQTQLVAQAATLYYQLISLDKQLEITKQTIVLRQQDIETVQLLMDAAYLTGADLEQSKANLYSAQLSVPDLELQIQQTENALSILMNDNPQAIDRNSIDSQIVYTDLKTGIPVSLLKNRPDVQAAEMTFRQAFENKNVALAQVYPTFNITATLGLSTRTLENFFTNSLFYTVGGTLTQNIFQQGNRKAQVRVTEARKQQAYFTFQKTLLTAGSEVSNALLSYQKAKEKESTRQLQIQSLEKALEFNKELLTYSSNINYVNVLTAEQALLQAKLSGVNDKLQQLQAVTEFYRALGGGQF